MNQLNVDFGLVEYALGNGVLRFNPADPGLYARFFTLSHQLEQMQNRLQQGAEQTTDPAAVLQLLEETDRQFKELLTRVFGPGNDFFRLLEGVNLLAVAGNGLCVAENLLEALEPILLQGAEQFVQAQTNAAREKARLRRERQ